MSRDRKQNGYIETYLVKKCVHKMKRELMRFVRKEWRMTAQCLLCVVLVTGQWIQVQAASEHSVVGIEDYNEATAKTYLDNHIANLAPVEGIWQSSDGFKYAIERDVEDGYRVNDRYRMIILEAGSDAWEERWVKGYISKGSMDGLYSLKYYTNSKDFRNLSSQIVVLLVENAALMSFQRIDGGDKVSLYRLYPTVNSDVTPIPAGVGAAESWSGTAVAIDKTHLVTNHHVVDGAKTLTISGFSNTSTTEYNVEVIASDKNNDIAVLKVTDASFDGFSIKYGSKTTTADVGTEIYVLGYPLTATMGDDIKLTTGVISSRSGFQGDFSQYQMTAAVQPGSSGGPLFDKKGNLIGVVSAKHMGAENTGYCVKLSYLRTLLESLDEKISLPQTNVISTLPLSEQVKAAAPCVVVVKANTREGTNSSLMNINISSTDHVTDREMVTERLCRYYFWPPIRFKNSDNLYIFAVLKSSYGTVISFADWTSWYDWVQIDEKSYITDTSTGEVCKLMHAEGISTKKTPVKHNEWYSFALFFPPLPEECCEINFSEGAKGGWEMQGIRLIR